jgi:predicted phage terminase large subunit-like protein
MALAVTKQDEFDFFLRRDFVGFAEFMLEVIAPNAFQSFVPSWHHHAISNALMRVWWGECRRLIIVAPPRSLKSVMTSVAFPAWCLGHDPAQKFLCASHSLDLVGKHSRDFGLVIRSPAFRRIFPHFALAADREAQNEIVTTMRGGRFATSPGGSVTGRGGDFWIIDDPHKADEIYSEELRGKPHRWFLDTALSRLDDKSKGAIVLVMQRLHPEDMAGRLIQAGGWEVLELPAYTDRDRVYDLGAGREHTFRAGEYLQPEREGRAALDQIRREMGTPLFNAQYLQAPEEMSGGLVKFDYLHFYDEPLAVAPDDYVLQSWDIAVSEEPTADWSVCTTWIRRRGILYLLDVWRARQGLPELIASAKRLARQWSVDEILIETDGVGLPFRQSLVAGLQPDASRRRDTRAEARLSPRAMRGEGWDPNDVLIRGERAVRSKADRLVACLPHIEAGRVRLPTSASWREVYLRELLTFSEAGNGHDDQVDSTSAAIQRLITRPGAPTISLRVH